MKFYLKKEDGYLVLNCVLDYPENIRQLILNESQDSVDLIRSKVTNDYEYYLYKAKLSGEDYLFFEFYKDSILTLYLVDGISEESQRSSEELLNTVNYLIYSQDSAREGGIEIIKNLEYIRDYILNADRILE